LSPEVFQHLLAHYGYWAIFCIVGLESVGIPLPGEMIVILASVWASQHGGNIAFVIAAAAAGAIVGDNIGYWIGREYGYKLLVKHAPRMGLTQGQLKLGQYLFQKYGVFVVFFGRFIAFLRILAAFLSGVNRLEWAKFMLANAAGGIAWASAVALTPTGSAGRRICFTDRWRCCSRLWLSPSRSSWLVTCANTKPS